MAKNKDDKLGEHVKFTKGDLRPYVTPYDLVTSKNFQETVERAIKKRQQALGNTLKSDDQ